MYIQVCLSLALLVAIPAWSQVPIVDGPAGLSTSDGLGSTDQMLTPAPVNDQAYPTAVGAEKRSNYFRAGLVVTSAYSDNVLADVAHPVSDIDYSIYPTIALDKATSRIHFGLIYSPGFTVYQSTSSENQADQYVALNFQYRLTRHVTVSLHDSLQQTSNVFNQADPFSGEAISGSPQPPLDSIIVPVASQLANGANAEMTYQFSRNGMVGVSGTFNNLHYFHPSEVLGVYDSSSSGGSAFYSHRLSRRHYIGATYRYSKILAYPVNAESDIQTHTMLFFYTIYLKPTISFSLSGGPQHVDVVQFPLPAYGSLSPTFTASMGWQERHINLSAAYSRVVTGGGGLVGAFQSDMVSAYARWRIDRTWSVGAVGNYANNKNVTPSSFISTVGGHTIFGTVSAQRQLSEHLTVDFGYTRLHQSYGGIPVISNAPTTNREFISFSYNFARPLGG